MRNFGAKSKGGSNIDLKLDLIAYPENGMLAHLPETCSILVVDLLDPLVGTIAFHGIRRLSPHSASQIERVRAS